MKSILINYYGGMTYMHIKEKITLVNLRQIGFAMSSRMKNVNKILNHVNKKTESANFGNEVYGFG